MSSINEIKQSIDFLTASEHELAKEVYNRCISTSVSLYLEKILNDRDLTPDEVNFVQSFVPPQTPILLASTVNEMVSKMSMFSRDQSHGSVEFKKLYTGANLYKELTKDLDFSGPYVCNILGVEVKPNAFFKDTTCAVIGFCKPKFKNIPVEHLVIFGNVS